MERLGAIGRRAVSAEVIGWAVEANRHPPELDMYDRWGRRIDEGRFRAGFGLRERRLGRHRRRPCGSRRVTGRDICRADRQAMTKQTATALRSIRFGRRSAP
ncbi:hypothetical protein [Sphingomonas oryzagri]